MSARQETGDFRGAVKTFRESHSAVKPNSDWFEIADPQDPDGPVMVSIRLHPPPNDDFLGLRVETTREKQYGQILPDERSFIVDLGLILDSQGNVTNIGDRYTDNVAMVWCVLAGSRYVLDYIKDPQDPCVATLDKIQEQKKDDNVTRDISLSSAQQDRVKQGLSVKGIPLSFDVPATVFRILSESLSAQDIKRQPFVLLAVSPQPQSLPVAV